MPPATQTITAIDSHTGGEPTRIVTEGGPDLGTGSVAEQLESFRKNHDRFRSAVVNEPRGSDVVVGALICKPADPKCSVGVIFFNNVGYLGMCGHGTIGLMATLAHLGRIKPGSHFIETPVGVISAELERDGTVCITNVPSHRTVDSLEVEVPGLGTVRGDVAWGGNWFFLTRSIPGSCNPPLTKSNVDLLTDITWRIRTALNSSSHPEVDHIELFSPALDPANHSRNFVLCPGKAYDRSPCGTGTSAKLACLAADGKLAEGEVWRQESILGSVFHGSYSWLDRSNGIVIPTIRGTAHVVARTELILDPSDPFCWGIRD